MKNDIYLFAGSLTEAAKIAAHFGYGDVGDGWIYVDTPLERYIRASSPRDIYFCGVWYERGDAVSRAMRLCEQKNWRIHTSNPPRQP